MLCGTRHFETDMSQGFTLAYNGCRPYTKKCRARICSVAINLAFNGGFIQA
jgi:hypothetical protein